MFGLKNGSDSKRDDPLATPRAATGWLGSLPEGNLEATVENAALMLTGSNDADHPPAIARLKALLLVDQELQPLLGEFRLTRLLQTGAAAADAARWDALKAVYKQLARAYQRYIAAFLEGASELDRETIAFATLRAILAVSQRAKVGYLQQQALDQKYWKILHKLFRFADASGFATRPIEGSNSQPMAASDAYLRALFLATASTGGFSAKQIEIADDWLAAWCRGTTLDREFSARRHLYYVNLGGDIGPRRIYDVKHDELCRYISTDALLLQIDRSRQSVREGQALTELGLNATFRGAEFMETLDRLERTWSNPANGGDQRGQPRVAAQGRTIGIVRSLPDLCRVAKKDFDTSRGLAEDKTELSAAEELDLKVYGFVTERTKNRVKTMAMTQEVPLRVENWPLQDESSNGYGAIIEGDMAQGLRIGSLLGVKQDGSKRWGVGIVQRKITRKDSAQTLIGIEMISLTPIIVTLRQPDQDVSQTGTMIVPVSREAQWALFLPGDRSQGRADSLIVDIALYGQGRKYVLQARNVSYLITMTRVIRRGEGWERVGFDVLSKRG